VAVVRCTSTRLWHQQGDLPNNENLSDACGSITGSGMFSGRLETWRAVSNHAMGTALKLMPKCIASPHPDQENDIPRGRWLRQRPNMFDQNTSWETATDIRGGSEPIAAIGRPYQRASITNAHNMSCDCSMAFLTGVKVAYADMGRSDDRVSREKSSDSIRRSLASLCLSLDTQDTGQRARPLTGH